MKDQRGGETMKEEMLATETQATAMQMSGDLDLLIEDLEPRYQPDTVTCACSCTTCTCTTCCCTIYGGT
jgi:hypothetical protein